MATVVGPKIGLSKGKPRPRANFRVDKFIKLIETKGIRLAWARGSMCPCKGINDQTGQPNPNCTLCLGGGFFWFRPPDYVVPDEAGDLNTLQSWLVDSTESVVIRGTVVGVKRTEDAYNSLGQWVFGSFNVSVRPENKLGYYDRLVALDSVLDYQQLTTVELGAVKFRYPVVGFNLLRSETQILEDGVDYRLLADGTVEFLGTPPADGTVLAAHYRHHPQLLVFEHTNAFRDSLTSFKLKGETTTPLGNPQQLPVRALARLDYLPVPVNE